jgi:hypothetical protein
MDIEIGIWMLMGYQTITAIRYYFLVSLSNKKLGLMEIVIFLSFFLKLKKIQQNKYFYVIYRVLQLISERK